MQVEPSPPALSPSSQSLTSHRQPSQLLQVAPCPSEVVRQVQPRAEDGDMKLLLLKCTMDVALAIGVRGAAGCGGGKCEEGVYVGSMWPQNITQSVGQWRNEWSCVYAFN